MISMRNGSLHQEMSLVCNIKRFLKHNLETEVIHIYREVNNYADKLVKMRATSVQDISLFNECRQEL